MNWIIYALLGAFFDAAYFALIKKYLPRLNPSFLSCGVFLTTAIILSLISVMKGIPKLNTSFYYSLLITGLLGVISAVLYFKALEKSDISLVVPMLSFTPVFLIVTSYFILGEITTIYGIIGILLILIGSYTLNITKENTKFLEPVKAAVRDRGVVYILVVALLFSISANFDKQVILNSNPFFGPAMIYLFLGLSFLGIVIIKYGFKSINFLKSIKENVRGIFLIVGTLTLGTIVVPLL